jgi:hypothetical protein
MKHTGNGNRPGATNPGNGNREGKTHHKPARTLTTEQQPGKALGVSWRMCIPRVTYEKLNLVAVTVY